jgi:acyl carrier protein
MNIEREKIVDLVFKSLNSFFIEYDLTVDLSDGEQTKLFGGDGVLDSLGLVSFIVSLEEAIEDEFNISIVLADEKAMSRRTSPFARINALVDYIFEVINTN